MKKLLKFIGLGCCIFLAIMLLIASLSLFITGPVEEAFVALVCALILLIPVMVWQFKRHKRKSIDIENSPAEWKHALSSENNRTINEYSTKERAEDFTVSDDQLGQLTTMAMENSALFAQKLQSEIDQIQWSVLQNIFPGTSEPLSDIEVLFLNYCDGRSSKQFSIAGYWVHDYKLNVNDLLQKFFRSGYLEFSDASFALTKILVPELKEILSSHHLKISGRKAELVKRILENVSPEDLQQYSHIYLRVTEKGHQVINNRSYLTLFFKAPLRYSITLEEASEEHRKFPDLTAPQLAQNILKRNLNKHLNEKSWGLYRNTLSDLSFTYQLEGENKAAWLLLLQVYLLDVTGFGNNNMHDHSLAFSAPAIISEISNYLFRNPNTNLRDELKNAANDLPVIITSNELHNVYSRLQREMKEQQARQ